MILKVAIKKPTEDSPIRLTVDVRTDGRIQMLNGNPILNSRGSLPVAKLETLSKAKKYNEIPEDCFFHMGINAGDVIVYTAADWDDMTTRKVSEQIAELNIIAKLTEKGFVLCVRQDCRENADEVTVNGVKLSLGAALETTTEHYGRKLVVRPVASWVVENDDESNCKWWKKLRADLMDEGTEDYNRKHAAEDCSPSLFGQEAAVAAILEALETPINKFVAECRKDVRREASGGVCTYFAKYAKKAVAAYMAGERDLEKLKAIRDEIDSDPGYIEASLGM